jgi:hypothetical protein
MADAGDQAHDEPITRHGDLEIEEDLEAQRSLWRVQRVVRPLALSVLVLALAGGLGRGPLSGATVTRDGLSVRYERIAHRDSPQTYRLTLAEDLAASGTVSLWLDRRTLRAMRPRRVLPEPVRSRIGADRTTFVFDVDPEGGLEILLELEPDAVGLHRSTLGVAGGPTVSLGQLLLP